jgi:hypothetical protein
LVEQGSEPATVVFGGVQSEYAFAVAKAVAGPVEAVGGEPDFEVEEAWKIEDRRQKIEANSPQRGREHRGRRDKASRL